MNAADFAGIRLGEVISGLMERGEIECLGGLKGLGRRLVHPTLTVCTPAEVMAMREGQATIALFLSPCAAWVRWGKWGDALSIPVFKSSLDLYPLMGKIKGLLRELCEGVKMLHGSLIAVKGHGILLTGPSGVGKSSCAWLLMKRGHRMIADDAVILKRTREGCLLGQAPERTRGYIHLRGKGIVRLPERNLVESAPVFLNVDLTKEGEEKVEQWKVCGVSVPRVQWKGGGGEELARRVEELVH